MRDGPCLYQRPLVLKASLYTVQPARDRLLKDCPLIFLVPDPYLDPIFRTRGRSPDLGNAIFGVFGPLRIELDSVSSQTVDSATQSWHLCKSCLLGWGTTCFELRVLSGIAFQTLSIGPNCAGPSFFPYVARPTPVSIIYINVTIGVQNQRFQLKLGPIRSVSVEINPKWHSQGLGTDPGSGK